MEVGLAKALTPVSPGLPSTTYRSPQTASGTGRPAAVPPVVAPERSQQQIEAIASQLQEFLSSSERNIEFRVDADTHAQVVTVRDAASGEVIRQFPNEDVLRVLKNLTAEQGTLFDGVA